MDGNVLKRRYEVLKKDRSPVEQVWSLVERFIAPFRIALFSGSNSQVDWKKREIFDSTAIKASTDLVAHIHGAATSPFFKWFVMSLADQKLRDQQEAMEWIQECDRINYDSLKKTNFDTEINEYYLDLVNFAAGALSSMPKEDSSSGLKEILYKTFPIDECFFEYDSDGNITAFYRLLKWNVDQIVDKFSLAKVTKEIREAFHAGEKGLSTQHDILFCVYLRKDKQNANTFSILKPKNRPYGVKYILYSSGEMLGDEGGEYEMPVFSSRWGKVSGSSWGFCPSMIAIWDVLTLNQLTQLTLLAAEKVIDPTILTTKKGVYSDIDLGSGGIVVVQDVEKSIRPFESNARFDVSSLTKQELVRAINDAFFINELKLKESPAMTAAEVYARVQLMQGLLGPSFGRIEHNVLSPAVTRNFMINFRYKKFPPMPPALAKTELKIDYIGAISKSQQTEQANAARRWVGSIGELMEVFPEVRDIPNIDEYVRTMADYEEIPARLVRSEAAVKADRIKRQKDLEAMKKLESVNAGGTALQNVGKGIGEMKKGMGAPEEVAQ